MGQDSAQEGPGGCPQCQPESKQTVFLIQVHLCFVFVVEAVQGYIQSVIGHSQKEEDDGQKVEVRCPADE